MKKQLTNLGAVIHFQYTGVYIYRVRVRVIYNQFIYLTKIPRR